MLRTGLIIAGAYLSTVTTAIFAPASVPQPAIQAQPRSGR